LHKIHLFGHQIFAQCLDSWCCRLHCFQQHVAKTAMEKKNWVLPRVSKLNGRHGVTLKATLMPEKTRLETNFKNLFLKSEA
jgi:hypothetical protein